MRAPSTEQLRVVSKPVGECGWLRAPPCYSFKRRTGGKMQQLATYCRRLCAKKRSRCGCVVCRRVCRVHSCCSQEQRRSAARDFGAILTACRAARSPFVDPDFLPNDDSLYGCVGARCPTGFVRAALRFASSREERERLRLEWGRAHRLGRRWSVVRDDIRPDDIVQGVLGGACLRAWTAVHSAAPQTATF